jgi:LmbE family N-acetylglucosaminyl deacetylase
MMPLVLPPGQDRLSVLCLGAHSDDIEIGAGATLLQWFATDLRFDVRWCVLSARGEREGEARRSASDFLEVGTSRRS